MTIMRKVLLATTALIAVGTVQAASADVTISGSYEWQYNTWDKSGTDYSSTTDSDNSITNEIDVNIAFSATTDSGLTLAMNYGFTEVEGTNESVGATISGDFGTIGLSDKSGMGEFGDKFATAVDVAADPATPFTVGESEDQTAAGAAGTAVVFDTPGDEMVDSTHNGLNYLSPDMNGFQFSIGYRNGGASSHADVTAGGFQYAMSAGDASITLKYAMSAMGDSSSGAADGKDATSLGLVLGLGDATVTVAQNTKESDNGTDAAYDYKSTGVGIGYTVSDSLSVAAYTASGENDKDSNYDVNENGVSFTYTIADGLSASVTHTDMDVKDNDDSTSTSGNYTVVAVNLSF
jgi:predicted porin